MQYNSELQQIRTQRFAYLVLSCGLTVTLASPKGKHPKLSPALGSPQRRPVVGMRFRCSERFEAWTLQPSRGPCVPMLMAERLGSCTVEGWCLLKVLEAQGWLHFFRRRFLERVFPNSVTEWVSISGLRVVRHFFSRPWRPEQNPGTLEAAEGRDPLKPCRGQVALRDLWHRNCARMPRWTSNSHLRTAKTVSGHC